MYALIGLYCTRLPVALTDAEDDAGADGACRQNVNWALTEPPLIEYVITIRPDVLIVLINTILSLLLVKTHNWSINSSQVNRFKVQRKILFSMYKSTRIFLLIDRFNPI